MLSKRPQPGTLFQIRLDQFIDLSHKLCILSNKIDWDKIEQELNSLYCHNNGLPAKPIRLMAGLHFLKYMYNLSDEAVVEQWLQNPYWQYFCGEEYYQKARPIDPTRMTRWRKRVESHSFNTPLQETIKIGLRLKIIRKSDLENVNVDTTVMKKT